MTLVLINGKMRGQIVIIIAFICKEHCSLSVYPYAKASKVIILVLNRLNTYKFANFKIHLVIFLFSFLLYLLSNRIKNVFIGNSYTGVMFL